jgi:hypothetical protein
MHPALMLLLPSLGYGQVLVSYVHQQIVGLITDPLILASHRSFIHFGEDRRLLPLIWNNLTYPGGDRK